MDSVSSLSKKEESQSCAALGGPTEPPPTPRHTRPTSWRAPHGGGWGYAGDAGVPPRPSLTSPIPSFAPPSRLLRVVHILLSSDLSLQNHWTCACRSPHRVKKRDADVRASRGSGRDQQSCFSRWLSAPESRATLVPANALQRTHLRPPRPLCLCSLPPPGSRWLPPARQAIPDPLVIASQVVLHLALLSAIGQSRAGPRYRCDKEHLRVRAAC